MEEIEVKSYKAKDGMVHLYSDAEGADLILSIPMWMFEQMANKLLTVKYV